MAPRSATRRKPKQAPTKAKGKRSTPNSKQLDVESSPVDQGNVDLEIKGEELEDTVDTGNQKEGVFAAAKDGESEHAAVPRVTAVEQIKPEIRALNPNSGFKPKVKEEVVKEEGDVDDIIGDHINVKIEGSIEGSGDAEEGGERMEGVQREGVNDKNDDAHAADVTEKCDYATEENGAEGEQNVGRDGDSGGAQLVIVPGNGIGEGERYEGRDGDSDGTQLTIVPGNGIGEGEHIEGRNGDNGETQLAIVPDQNSCNEGTAAAHIGDAEVLGHNDSVLVTCEVGNGIGGNEVGIVDNGDSEEDDKVENQHEEHPSVLIDNHGTESKKENDLEIFIGRLDKGAVEDDLIEVFGKFGEIRSVRLVRKPTTNQSRGFAFIQYATVEQAKNALSALKDGIQVGGKHVKISASQDNDTLYVGNICKLWTKEQVLETLKSYGVENIEEIHVPNDSKKEGKIMGFALVEFSTHTDALAAFQRLRKPDAVFGRDKSAKVAFSPTPMHPREEVLSQVKTVYVEGLTDAWNERKVKEYCKQYGEVVKVKLSWSLRNKHKGYGLVTFTSRECALACVEGINNARIGEGEVKASIARPHVKGRLQKQGTRGGFIVTGAKKVPSTKEESERANKVVSPNMKGHSKFEKAKKKAKMVAEEKGKALCEPEIGGVRPNEHQAVTEDEIIRPSSKLKKKNCKRKNQHPKVEGRGKTGTEDGHNEKRLKMQMGNKRGRQSINSRKPKRDMYIRKGPNYGAGSINYRNQRAPGYDASSVSYQSYSYTTTTSGSKRPYADMEPHAGYLEPVARKQGRRNSGYVEPTVGIPPVRIQYQPLVRYQKSAVATQSQPQTRYPEPAVVQYSRPHAGYVAPAVGTYGQRHTGYLEPAVGRQSQSHAVYSESAVPKYNHDPYSRRAGQQDLHASGYSAYGSGSSLPNSYVASYTNYGGYEGGSSVSGRYESSSGGANLLQRAYY